MHLLLSACTEKAKPVIRHEVDLRTSEPATLTATKAQDFRVDAIGDVDQLAAKVLDPKRIADPYSLQSQQVLAELIAFNDHMLSGKVSVKILRKYVAGLFMQCGEIKSSCLGLNYFRMAYNSSQVIKLIALRPEFQNEQVRLLLFAVELKNKQPDPQLLKLVLLHIPPSDPTIRSFLDSSLLLASQQMKDPKEIYAFLDDINAWDLWNSSATEISPGAMSAIWSMIGRSRYLYNSKGQLHPGLRKVMDKFNSRPDSLSMRLKQVSKLKTFKPNALGLNTSNGFEELYFILDVVFLQAISSQDAFDALSTVNLTPDEKIDLIENYVRTRFVVALYDSTMMAKSIFTASVSTESLLTHAISQSSQVRQVWGALKSQLSTIRNVASMVAQQSSHPRTLDSRIRSLFDSFSRSVQLASVYPHTLLLFHMLSQKRFTVSIFGLGEVDTADLMSLLFHGSIPPILSYTDRAAPLNHFEMIHAFDMAVRTQLFATVDIDLDKFMSDTLGRLNQEPIQFIEKNLDFIEQRFRESKSFSDFKVICNELKTAARIPRMISLTGFAKSPILGEMISTLYSSIAQRMTKESNGPELDEEYLHLFYLDGNFSELLEKTRLELRATENLGEAMLASYRDYLRRHEGLSEDQISARTVQTQNVIARSRKLKQRVVDSAKTLYQNVGWCYFKALKQHLAAAQAIIQSEKNYLASIYRDMSRLRQGVSETEKQRIMERHTFSGLPSNFRGQSRLDKDSYYLSSIDFLLRSVRTTEKIFPHITVNLGSKLDLDVDLVKNTKYSLIQYTSSEEEFVKSGLRAVFPARDRIASWLHSITGYIDPWDDYIESLIASHRLEQDLTGGTKVFTAETILQAHEELLQVTQMDGERASLLSTLQLRSFFDPIHFGHILLDNGKGAYGAVGLFDFPVKVINEETLGYDHEINVLETERIRTRRFGHLALGRLYYRARSLGIRGNPIIPFNKALDQVLDEKVGKLIRGELETTRLFQQSTLKYIHNFKQRPPAKVPFADIDIYTRIVEPLSDVLIPSYEANLVKFHQATQNCYIQKCADF